MPFNSSYSGGSLPPWMEQTHRGMAERSEFLRGEGYKPYRGQRLAPYLNPDIERAEEYGRDTEGHIPLQQEGQDYTQQGAEEFPENAERYMTPYQKNVIQGLQDESGRAFREQFLPAIEKQFVAAGQHGSSRHQELVQRATREHGANLQRQIARLMHEGYTDAGKRFDVGAARKLEAATQRGDQAKEMQASRLLNMAALKEQGVGQRAHEQGKLDIKYGNYQRQEAYPHEALSQQAGVMSGMPAPVSTYRAEVTPGTPQLNTTGQLGALATGLYGARQAGGYGRKAGGSVKKKQGLSRLSLSEGTFARSPKLGGSKGFKHMKNKDRGAM